MSIYKTAINKPITTLLIFVAVIVLGVFSLSRLPIDQFPEMEVPYVAVMTTYAGANGSEIETNVTKLLENALNSIDGLKEISSTSKDNVSLINLELEWEANIDESVNDLRSAIDMVYDNLPEGCSRPLIFKFNTAMMPIIQYAITAKESYPGLKKLLEENVINVLNRVEGIGNLSLSGAPERYVYIDLDQNKLDAYNLSVESVGQSVTGNNLNLASGTVKMGKEQYQLRVQGEFVESAEINNIVVSTDATGKQVFLRDIALVRDTIKDLSLDEKVNGADGVRLVVMKQTGANTVQVASQVRKMVEEIQPTLPPDVQFDVIYDSSDNIQNSINGLQETILYALLFVVLVVLLFLGKWRSTIIVAISIPISLVSSFIYLYFVDSSLNIISMSALTLAIGMVVDDAIVVLENINKHIERGSRPREAAIYGTNEVWVSIIASTLVIVAVFLPLTMLGGQMGIMFKELGWIVTITIGVSAMVAISITPMLSSKLLKTKPIRVNADGQLEESSSRRSWYENSVGKWLDKLDAWYASILRYSLTHKKIMITGVVVVFIASLVPVIMGKIGMDFMPEQDNGRLSINIELQRGTRVEESMRIARQLELKVAQIAPEVELISTTTGTNDDSGISALFTSSSNNKIAMTVRTSAKQKRERSIFVIAEEIRKYFDKVPEIINYQVSTAGGFGGGGSSTVDVEIYGYDFNTTNAFAEDLKQRLKDIDGARNITVSREEDRAELQINFDKEKLALHGLSEAVAGAYVRNRINGMVAGFLREDGEEYNIVARLKEEYRNSISDIENMTLMTPVGSKIKLKELGTVQEYWGPPNIEHKRRQRIVTVQVTPVGVSLGDMATTIRAEFAKMEIPQGILLNVGGSYEDMQESTSDLFSLLILILLLVYIVMASQFESFMKPLLLMSSVPFAFSGVILALFITGINLDMIGMLGAVLLVGIVVKNGIVLVDYINLMRDRGYELNEAIALSGQSRLRPVLMTSLTTLLGMVPMALSTAEGSEMWQPLGVVVIGGLLFSTVITLVIVPVLYAIVSRHGERDKIQKQRKEYIFMQLADEDIHTKN
ncbi:MAG: efflux RND transporter permease subunit [Prevotellaceae bacterium]|jgi:HAE1 family hydrophobic/amphiphilic exporter-1|nr:efflux RND transporter permease subunit [Prevotellaceae bacterium]